MNVGVQSSNNSPAPHPCQVTLHLQPERFLQSSTWLFADQPQSLVSKKTFIRSVDSTVLKDGDILCCVQYRLWVHEVFRVYYDRLVDDEDRSWLYSLLKNVVKSHFKEDFNGIFKHLSSSGKVYSMNKTEYQ